MNKNPIYKILFVDDDSVFFNVLSGRLSREGILVTWAKDGKTAIELALEKLPDIIITDVIMPGLNGFDLIRELKQYPKTANIEYLILSNYGENRIVYDLDFLNSLGIRKYLIKSNYTPAELTKEIKKSIRECKINPLKQ